jgi:outer membrane protein OmpA-like peptidoglycan-associated protein
MKPNIGSGSTDYRLHCHACDTLQQSTGVCLGCGPVLFHYRPEASQADPRPVCSDCNRPAEAVDGVPPAPKKCQSCSSTDMGAKDWQTQSWRPESLTPVPGEEPWICGDFDGDCDWLASPAFSKFGSQTDDPLANSLNLARMNRTQVEDLSFVDGPPDQRSGTDPRPPLRLGTVPNVYVYRFQDGERRLYEVTLKDVRLHDWQQTTGAAINDGPIHGRLQGKVYARLALKQEELPRKRRDFVGMPARRWNKWLGPRASATPAGAAGMAPTNKSVTDPQTPDVSNYCNTCNLFLMAAVFLCLYLVCSLTCALAAGAAMALQCWWRSSRLRRGLNRMSDLAEILICIVLVSAGVLLYYLAREPACEGQPVYLWLAGIALLLVLTALLRRCWPWFLLTLLWGLALLTYACGAQPNCTIASPAVATESSGTSPDAPAGKLSWLPSLSLTNLNPLPSLGHAMDKVRDSVDQLLAQDPDAQRVDDESTGNGRVSVDDALRHPNRYFTCNLDASRWGTGGPSARHYSIYLGEAALFNKDSAVLGPSAEPHLRKLARLIASQPNAHIVLTGHADRSGQREYNLSLSQQRAIAVADWLLAHQVLPADQIEIRAAGDRQPLVDNPSLNRLNRRVEVGLDCGTGGGQ